MSAVCLVLTEIIKDDQPFKRSPQTTGYLYSPPDNPLELPSEKLQLRAETEAEAGDTERALQAEESETSFVRASPISVSTPGTLNIIQEIQIRSTQAPRRKLSGKLRLSPSQRPRVPKQQSSPALRFSDNPLVAVLGRQVQGAPVEVSLSCQILQISRIYFPLKGFPKWTSGRDSTRSEDYPGEHDW